MLASTSYKHKISGSKRTYENNTQVGEVYFGDIAYLPQSRRGYRFCLVIVERLTSFVSAIPLKSLNAESTSNAIRLFVGIIGFSMSKFCSDYGPEFGSKFTAQLNTMGIEHTSRIPRRSQSQGNVEVAIKILKQALTKVCASRLSNK